MALHCTAPTISKRHSWAVLPWFHWIDLIQKDIVARLVGWITYMAIMTGPHLPVFRGRIWSSCLLLWPLQIFVYCDKGKVQKKHWICYDAHTSLGPPPLLWAPVSAVSIIIWVLYVPYETGQDFKNYLTFILFLYIFFIWSICSLGQWGFI